MKKSEFINILTETLTEKQLSLTESAIKTSVNTLLSYMIQKLADGKRLEIRGFGSFHSSLLAPKVMYHPSTGKKINVTARHRLLFRAGKKLKLRMNTRLP